MDIKLVDNKGKASTKKVKASDAIFAQDFKESLLMNNSLIPVNNWYTFCTWP